MYRLLAGILALYYRRTYSAYETGVNAMSPEILIRLARLHGTSVDYLLGLTQRREPYKK